MSMDDNDIMEDIDIFQRTLSSGEAAIVQGRTLTSMADSDTVEDNDIPERTPSSSGRCCTHLSTV
jgi:hypothetical protein